MIPPVDRAAIAALVPHAAGMCLWDEVVAYDDARIALRAWRHRDADHPLRDARGLRALHLCEYGAQAMAVHGGLLARDGGGTARPGLLVALRGVALHVARIDTLPGALECEAEALVRGDTGSQYAFRITHAGTLLADGRVAVLFHDGTSA